MHHEVESHAFFLSSLFPSYGFPINGVSSRDVTAPTFAINRNGDNAPTFSLVRINALGRGGSVTWKNFFFALEFATESQLDEFFITHGMFIFCSTPFPRWDLKDWISKLGRHWSVVNVILCKFIEQRKEAAVKKRNEQQSLRILWKKKASLVLYFTKFKKSKQHPPSTCPSVCFFYRDTIVTRNDEIIDTLYRCPRRQVSVRRHARS